MDRIDRMDKIDGMDQGGGMKGSVKRRAMSWALTHLVPWRLLDWLGRWIVR